MKNRTRRRAYAFYTDGTHLRPTALTPAPGFASAQLAGKWARGRVNLIGELTEYDDGKRDITAEGTPPHG